MKLAPEFEAPKNDFIAESWSAFVHLNRARLCAAHYRYYGILFSQSILEESLRQARGENDQQQNSSVEFLSFQNNAVYMGKDYGGITEEMNENWRQKYFSAWENFLETMEKKFSELILFLRLNPNLWKTIPFYNWLDTKWIPFLHSRLVIFA